MTKVPWSEMARQIIQITPYIYVGLICAGALMLQIWLTRKILWSQWRAQEMQRYDERTRQLMVSKDTQIRALSKALKKTIEDKQQLSVKLRAAHIMSMKVTEIIGMENK